MNFILEIHTIEKTILKDEATSVTIPTGNGEITVLYDHMPLITNIETGEIHYRTRTGDQYLFVSSGFVEIQNKRVIILADLIERAEEIDEKAAEAAKERAQEILKSGKVDTSTIASADADFRMALARLRVAQRRRRH